MTTTAFLLRARPTIHQTISAYRLPEELAARAEFQALLGVSRAVHTNTLPDNTDGDEVAWRRWLRQVARDAMDILTTGARAEDAALIGGLRVRFSKKELEKAFVGFYIGSQDSIGGYML